MTSKVDSALIILLITAAVMLQSVVPKSSLKKSGMRKDSPIEGALGDFINSYNMTYTTTIENAQDLNSFAKTCVKMFRPILDKMPNGLKSTITAHFNNYATIDSCGVSEKLAPEIKPFFDLISKTFSDGLTVSSQEAKKGVGCFDGTGVAKDLIRNAYLTNGNRIENNEVFSNIIENLVKSKAATAKDSLLNNGGSSLIQKATRRELQERLKTSFVQMKDINIDLSAQTYNSTTDSKAIGNSIKAEFITQTNQINHDLITCFITLEQAEYFRVLNMATPHSYIDKMFDRDLQNAEKVAASKVISLVTINDGKVQLDDGVNRGDIYTDSLNNIHAADGSLINILPSENIYNNHKKDKQFSINVGKSCFNYVNTYNKISVNILDDFINQCNQLIGLEECNYYGNMFNYNINTDLVDQTYIESLMNSLSLDDKKAEVDAKIGVERGNYEAMNLIVRTFNQTENQILQKWNQCVQAKKFDSEKMKSFLDKMMIAESTNKYGLSTMLGRCDVNFDKLNQAFSSYYMDFYIECKSTICRATCTGCENWVARDVVLTNSTELEVSCCDNYCGVNVKSTLEVPSTGQMKDFYGGEWFYIMSDEASIPLTYLTKMKVKTALDQFIKEDDIQKKATENAKINNTQAPLEYFTNSYLITTISDIIQNGSINKGKVIGNISNKFSLLSMLNLKFKNMTIDSFINTNIAKSDKGGSLSCYKGTCTAACESKDCAKGHITANPDASTMITPPDSKKSSASKINYDGKDVFVKGSQKYGQGQSGIKLSATKYQDQCIQNQAKLGTWSMGYDLVNMKLSVNRLKGDTSMDASEVTSIQGRIKFYQQEDAALNTLLYFNNSTNQMNDVFLRYIPHYTLGAGTSAVKDYLTVKSKLNLGTNSPHYFRGSTQSYFNLSNEELALEFNPDDWRPSFIKQKESKARLKYINDNFYNFGIDVQCNKVYCILLLTDYLEGTNYLDFYQKSIPLYNPSSMSQTQKLCFAKKILDFRTPNPFNHNPIDDEQSYYDETFIVENPFKNGETVTNNKFVVSVEEVSQELSTPSTDGVFIQLNAESKLSAKLGNKKYRSSIKLDKSTDASILGTSTSDSTPTSSSLWANPFQVDSDCGIENSPYSFFPIKTSCLAQVTGTCNNADFFKAISRYSKPAECPSLVDCSKITNDSSDQDFETCGDYLNEIFFRSTRVNIELSIVLSPCDANSLKSALELRNLRDNQTYINKDNLTQEDLILFNSIQSISKINSPSTMIIDGSTELIIKDSTTEVQAANVEVTPPQDAYIIERQANLTTGAKAFMIDIMALLAAFILIFA